MGLRARLALSHAVLALALVAAASFVLELQSARTRRSEAAEGAQGEAEVAAVRAARLLTRPPSLARLVADEKRGRRALEVVASDGEVLTGSVPATARATAARATSDALDGLASDRVVRGARYVVGAAPVLRSQEVVAAAVVVQRAPPIQPWTGPARLALLPGLLLVLAAAGAGWLVAGRVARPIEALTRSAGAFALGSVEPKVAIDGGRVPEVETLAAAVGRMVERTRAIAARARDREDRHAVALRRLSHQLRTPVSVLSLRLDEMAAEDTIPPRRAELSEVVNHQVELIATLSSGLADLARTAGDEGAVRVDVVKLVRAVATRLGPLARSAGIHLVVPIAAAIEAPVRADPATLEDAVTNVVENAIKFTPRGGWVWARVDVDESDVVVDVSDTGPGIPAAERDLVVLPWARGEAGADLPGTGLGLSLALDTVERAGGRLVLDDAPAGGARVRLVLPRLPD